MQDYHLHTFKMLFSGFRAIRGRDPEERLHAINGMEIDPLDPFVNLTMGRTEWLR